MSQNIEIAQSILKLCAENGVQDFCVCAGARNSPLLMTLAKASGLRLFHFFDERSAAFFALGRIKAHQNPVAVITTSGTAVAELLPATVEAHYAGLPLILITADRPRTYRGSGAPQAIEQVGIFSNYVEKVVDVEQVQVDFGLNSWSRRRPIQINVSFAEPLIDAEIPDLQFSEKKSFPLQNKPAASVPVQLDRPLVIVGALRISETEAVADFLIRNELFVYAEAQSNLRGAKGIHFLQNGDKLIPRLVKDGVFNSILRLGGVPTLRFWRDLEDQWKDLPVVSISTENWSGLSRSSKCIEGFEQLKRVSVTNIPSAQYGKIIEDDSALTAERNKLRLRFPKSEVTLIHQLSERIRSSDRVYLGNSLPIREWDLASSTAKKFLAIEANRGANGIDGQVSTFLGWSESSHRDSATWGIFGDLTALYDLSAPWVSSQLKSGIRRIVVINNGGGQIFRKMFQSPAFLNAHNLDFKAWAELWKWEYRKITELARPLDAVGAHLILEIVPDSKQSDAYNKADQLL